MSDEYNNLLTGASGAGGADQPIDPGGNQERPEPPRPPGTTLYLYIKSNDGTEELYSAELYNISYPIPTTYDGYSFFDGSNGLDPIGVYGEILRPPYPIRELVYSLEGYLGLTSTFGGQTPTVANGTILAEANSLVTSDIIYYVVPEPSGYTVTYSTVHGTTPAPAHDLFELTASELPVLTSEGCEFLGWFYEDTFETPAQIGDALEADITLYAKWNEIQNVVNAAALADSLKVTADAIRSRGVDGLQAFDMENRTGFKEAIELIPRGGQYIKVSDVPPESDEGIDGDIWIVVS